MFRQDFTCPALLEDLEEALPIRGYHPLWRTFPDASGCLLPSHWPGPRSLVTTSGVSVDVLSSGYLDISVPRVRSLSGDLIGRVSPFGNLRIEAYSRLPTAYRSVSRPSSPLNAKAFTKCPLRRLIRPCAKANVAAAPRGHRTGCTDALDRKQALIVRSRTRDQEGPVLMRSMQSHGLGCLH